MKKKASFVVNVYGTEHDTWQGQIIWTEKGRAQVFHSAEELFHMMEQAIGREQRKLWNGVRKNVAAEG